MKIYLYISLIALNVATGAIEKEKFVDYSHTNKALQKVVQGSNSELKSRATRIADILYSPKEREKGVSEVFSLLVGFRDYLVTGDYNRTRERFSELYEADVPGYIKGHALLIRYVEKNDNSDMKRALRNYPKLFKVVLDVRDSDILEYAEHLIQLENAYLKKGGDAGKLATDKKLQKTISEYFDSLFEIFLAADSSEYVLFLLANFDRYASGPSFSAGSVRQSMYENYFTKVEKAGVLEVGLIRSIKKEPAKRLGQIRGAIGDLKKD